MDLTDLRAALERHHARDGEGIVCAVCAEWWPCDAARALEEIDRLGLALHVARREDAARADAAEAQVVALLQDKAAAHARAEEREAELDLAIAHDRQLYPTAAAYEAVCVARDKHAARADAAEAQVIEAVEAVFTAEKSKHEAQAAALASAERERAEAALTVERVATAVAVAQDKVMGYEPGTHVAADYTILAAALRDALLKETT